MTSKFILKRMKTNNKSKHKLAYHIDLLFIFMRLKLKKNIKKRLRVI